MIPVPVYRAEHGVDVVSCTSSVATLNIPVGKEVTVVNKGANAMINANLFGYVFLKEGVTLSPNFQKSPFAVRNSLEKIFSAHHKIHRLHKKMKAMPQPPSIFREPAEALRFRALGCFSHNDGLAFISILIMPAPLFDDREPDRFELLPK